MAQRVSSRHECEPTAAYLLPWCLHALKPCRRGHTGAQCAAKTPHQLPNAACAKTLTSRRAAHAPLVPAGDGRLFQLLPAPLLFNLLAQLRQAALLGCGILLCLPQPLLVLYAPRMPCLLVEKAESASLPSAINVLLSVVTRRMMAVGTAPSACFGVHSLAASVHKQRAHAPCSAASGPLLFL